MINKKNSAVRGKYSQYLTGMRLLMQSAAGNPYNVRGVFITAVVASYLTTMRLLMQSAAGNP